MTQSHEKILKKTQKSYLGDNMVNVHKKSNAGNHASCVSYSFFCILKPFWVLKATEKYRNTCELSVTCKF